MTKKSGKNTDILQDAHGRIINYLRISVTDRCDLRCTYCMPAEGVPQLNHSEILRFEEIEAVVRVGAELGIKNARITGGEPLTRAGITSLIQKLSVIPGLKDLSITTNGVLFSKMGFPLREAGLRRVNFGISSLNSDIYYKLTRSSRLPEALEGLEAAIKLGFEPIKLNVVVIRGINEDLSDFITLVKEKPVHVRFIEYMRIGAADYSSSFVPASEIRRQIGAAVELEPLNAPVGCGPIQNAWRVSGGQGSIAIIAPVTEHVCEYCNRLRLTADGHLRPCLFSADEIDIKPALRPAFNTEMLKSLFVEATQKKPGNLRETTDFGRSMSQIGG
ncbi:MAG: GTP 3',8-cyclase MoaA [Holophagales bacterium]|nr:GTP 3',8-cyclase MoaA [Holophagales bacterium]